MYVKRNYNQDRGECACPIVVSQKYLINGCTRFVCQTDRHVGLTHNAHMGERKKSIIEEL